MNDSSSRASHAPFIIGHRGASAIAPENTIAAFERALADGADGIEFDVRLAGDGVPVVIHDADLRRTGLSRLLVANLSSSELGKVDVGTWFNLRHPDYAQAAYSRERIATLAEVFELMKNRGRMLYVEMKCAVFESGALAAEVAGLTRSHSMIDSVVVESFTLEAIAEIKRLAPEIRTAALFEPKLSRPRPSARRIIGEAVAHAADEIALHRSLVTRRVVEDARQRQLETVVWTVDNLTWVRRALDYGLHALITNRPAQMRARLSQLLDA